MFDPQYLSYPSVCKTFALASSLLHVTGVSAQLLTVSALFGPLDCLELPGPSVHGSPVEYWSGSVPSS